MNLDLRMTDLLETMNRTGTAGGRRTGNMKRMTMKRSFAITHAGHDGLVPSYAELVDEILVLVSGQVPYVLRETNRKHRQSQRWIHEFLGEAYIHGLIDGEIADLNRAADDVMLE
jgi:hypothetical protein